MSDSRTYHTKQEQGILDILEKMEKKYVTAGDVLNALKEEGMKVGLTTVYRRLDRLVKEGVVQKIVLDGNSGACYQYIGGKEEKGHFLLKCEDCGAIQDMDCGHMDELYSHVLEEHHFNVNPHRTMFYGICEKCLRK